MQSVNPQRRKPGVSFPQNYGYTILWAAVTQIGYRLLIYAVPSLRLHIHWLDILLCSLALLVLAAFEIAEHSRGRTTPLVAFFVRFSSAK